MSLDEIRTLDECVVSIDIKKIKIPKELLLKLGDDNIVRIGNTPLAYFEKNAAEGYIKIKSAFRNGNYELTIDANYAPKLNILKK
jgi:hypothetical protein